ncbi:MAG: sugar ABC transporter substrate-binding protein [Ignavibacteria bacterium]|nr:sugar ABC transporter substrate-binding protein [Ignavibacteria bacterium]
MKRFLLLLIILFLFQSCKKEEGNILKFWAMGVEGENVSKLIPEFEKKYNVKVKVQQIPWTAAHEKLITAYVSETLPDVFQLGNTWIPEFVALNAILPLDSICSVKGFDLNDYFSGILESNRIHGSLYGIPWYVDTRVLFYRSDLLKKAGWKEPPKTWDELYELSKKIKSITGNYAIYFPTNEWVPLIIFALQKKSVLLDKNYTEPAFTDSEFISAFDFLSKFYREKLSPSNITEVTNIYQAFEEGYVAMYITGPWNIAEFKKRISSKAQKLWMTAPLPSPDSNYPGVSLAGGASLVVNRESKNKDLAFKLIEFLSEPEVQIKFYKLVGSLPSKKTAWNDSNFVNDIYLKAFRIQLEKTQSMPKIAEWENIMVSKIQKYIEEVAVGRMSVYEACKKLNEETELLLEKRKYLVEIGSL